MTDYGQQAANRPTATQCARRDFASSAADISQNQRPSRPAPRLRPAQRPRRAASSALSRACRTRDDARRCGAVLRVRRGRAAARSSHTQSPCRAGGSSARRSSRRAASHTATAAGALDAPCAAAAPRGALRALACAKATSYECAARAAPATFARAVALGSAFRTASHAAASLRAGSPRHAAARGCERRLRRDERDSRAEILHGAFRGVLRTRGAGD